MISQKSCFSYEIITEMSPVLPSELLLCCCRKPTFYCHIIIKNIIQAESLWKTITQLNELGTHSCSQLYVSSGPSIEPCGTPFHSGRTRRHWTHLVLWQLIVESFTKVRWSAVSKALDPLQNIYLRRQGAAVIDSLLKTQESDWHCYKVTFLSLDCNKTFQGQSS